MSCQPREKSDNSWGLNVPVELSVRNRDFKEELNFLPNKGCIKVGDRSWCSAFTLPSRTMALHFFFIRMVTAVSDYHVWLQRKEPKIQENISLTLKVFLMNSHTFVYIVEATTKTVAYNLSTRNVRTWKISNRYTTPDTHHIQVLTSEKRKCGLSFQ